MLKLLLGLLLAIQAGPPVAPPGPARYQAGQVWEYRTRPGDEGSLLRIQRVEDWPGGGKVYHISVIGVRLGGQAGNEIQHLPVSQRTLDASVTRLSASQVAFPSPEEGIRMWREGRGGVFDISVAEIVTVAERTISGESPPSPAPTT